MAHHQLLVGADTAVDVYDRTHAPALVVEPGDRITVTSLDAAGHVERPAQRGRRAPMLLPEARGHCLTGPIAVAGARPGDSLAVHLEQLEPLGWGWTKAGGVDTPITRRLGVNDGPGAELLWDIADGVAVESRGVRVKTSPFLGILGTAPPEPGEHSTIPPRAVSGGNIDCRELVAGSTVYLPASVAGALLYLGDGHAAQGDGEVGGTAIECPMRTTLTVDLAADRPVPGVHAETPAGQVTFGFHADLNVATGDALEAMCRWIGAEADLDTATALAFASIVVDMRITQVANQTWGVHAVLPAGALERVAAV